MQSSDNYFSKYKITNPAYNVIRIAGRHIRDRASRYFAGRLIELGCGTKAKKLLVGDLVEEYIGLDHIDSPHGCDNVDIIGTAYIIPNKSDSFDCVLSTSVLEHLEEPMKALREAHRVLKPGGYAIYTIPLFWHLHEEPRDFYRFTRYGIKHIFEKVGFEIAELKPLSGFWITFGSEFNYYINRFNRGIFKPFISIWIAISNLLFSLLERIDSPEQWTWMYLVVAKKTE